MKKYKINYFSLAAGVLLFVFALVFAKIIPGGQTLQYIIIIVMFALTLIARFFKLRKKYRVNYYYLAVAILLIIFALIFAKVIPGGETLQYIIIVIVLTLALLARFLKLRKKY